MAYCISLRLIDVLPRGQRALLWYLCPLCLVALGVIAKGIESRVAESQSALCAPRPRHPNPERGLSLVFLQNAQGRDRYPDSLADLRARKYCYGCGVLGA